MAPTLAREQRQGTQAQLAVAPRPGLELLDVVRVQGRVIGAVSCRPTG